MSNVLDVLQERGFVEATTDDEGTRSLLEGPTTCYIGFDPTAPSLHVVSLLPIMGLVHLQRCGHKPIVIAGGGTGLIGDPSEKSQERNLLAPDEIAFNLEGIRAQLERFLDFERGTIPPSS